MLPYILVKLVDLYSFLILIYVIMSWIPYKKGLVADIDTALGKLCDPYLNLFRRIIPPIGMVDWSPIVALLVLEMACRLIVGILF